MNKHYLQSKVKSTGTAYLFFLFFGAHYAYLGNWLLQILFWITFGGLGLWGLFDLFTMSRKVNKYNAKIFQQIDEIENKEREAEHARNIAIVQAGKSEVITKSEDNE